MPQKSFRKFGTVRSRNISDLEDLTQSLNNLLDGLVEDTINESFISEDLDCIRQISTTGIDNEGFLKFANNEEVVLSPITLNQTVFQPSKTYQNRLDIIRVFSGEPRFAGGNGLSARYYNADQIISAYINGDGGDVPHFNSDPVAIETGADQNTTWRNGVFDYNGKISDALSGFGGGVEWEGFFIPTNTGSHEFEIEPTGLFHMDFEDLSTGNYVTAKRIGLQNTIAVKKVSDQEVELVDNTDQKYVGIGLIATTTDSGLSKDTKVAAFTTLSDTPSLTVNTKYIITFEDTQVVNGAVGDQFNLILKKTLGQRDVVHWDSPILEKFEIYKIKFRLLFPDTEETADVNINKIEKFIEFDFTEPLSAQGNLRYTRLYTTDYDFTNKSKGRVFNFIDNSVLAGGGEIGEAKGNANGYVEVKTSKKIDITYEPKTKLGTTIPTFSNDATDVGSSLSIFTDITKKVVIANVTVGSKVLTISDTTGIEIGNKVFGNAVPDALQPGGEDTEVIEIIINEGVILSREFRISENSSKITFIDHRGYVKRIIGNVANNQVNISGSGGNTTGLKTGMIAIANDGAKDLPDYTTITVEGASNNFLLSSNPNMINHVTGTLIEFFLYQSRGLVNDSLDAFCLKTGSEQTHCFVLSEKANKGDTILFVEGPGDNIDNVASGWKVQGSAFKNGEDTVTGKSTTFPFSITIANPLEIPISKGGNFTATNNDDSRILCCPPTDTSPPFEAFDTGLKTTPNDQRLVLNGGNLLFTNISATNVTDDGGSTDKINDADGNSPVNRTILIQTGVTGEVDDSDELLANDGTTFKLLCA